ncbi:MAG: CoA pyrophosphatase [Thermoanaerobaculia bacterium]|nr:CoA pyrophosphatase [Thermoanaerobaculia bacterium]
MEQAPHSWIFGLRERLASPPPRRLPPSDVRQASVLVPLYADAGQLWTVLVRRSEELPHHRGQIGFPGGGHEPGEDPWGTALRESEEELAIDPAQVIRLGELDEAQTPTGYRIVPCVGAVPYPLPTEPDEREIAEVFSVPILAFSDPRMVEDRAVEIEGQRHLLRIYHVGGRQIWGLTAAILRNLLERLGLTMPDGMEL